MRSASVVACFLLGCCASLLWAQAKSEKTEQTDKADKTPPPISSLTEIDGRTLDQWALMLKDADPSLREKAINTIPAYGDAAKHLVPDMLERCKDKDLGPRSKAIMALGLMKIDDRYVNTVVSTLAFHLQEDKQDAARLQAAMALARFGSEASMAMPALINGTQDTGSWQIRKASISALKRIGVDKHKGPDDRATRAMLRCANDVSSYVRVEAVQALGFMGKSANPDQNSHVIGKLKNLLNDRDKVIIIWAQTSLMALEEVNQAGLQNIAKHLTPNESLDVRGNALLALGAMGEKSKPCVHQIVPMLYDKDKGIVVAAAMALVAIGDKDPKAMGAMQELIDKKETDDRVREFLRVALKELKEGKKPEAAPDKKAVLKK